MKKGAQTIILALPFINKTLYNNTPVKKVVNHYGSAWQAVVVRLF
jgi:hypothetical protein